jgi:hypothetical protein
MAEWPDEKKWILKDGIYHFRDKSRFQGTLVNDKPHGQGQYFWDSWIVTGEFKEGQMIGIFKIENSNSKRSYTLNFSKNIILLLESNGRIVNEKAEYWIKVDQQIEFKNPNESPSLMTPIHFINKSFNFTFLGLGEINYNNGSCYSGAFSYALGNDPVYSGEGVYHYSNGVEFYVGGFLDNLPSGFGRRNLSFEFYEGSFDKGKRSGIGYETIKDKRKDRIFSTYEGSWLNDLKHGTGVETIYRDDDSIEIYRGTWLNGLKHGYFQVIVKGAIFYAGLFSHDVATHNYIPLNLPEKK